MCTIPGVDRVTAWGILAEIGQNMGQFLSAAHLASWACHSALYRRIAARRGAKRAVMAVAHAPLVIAYHMLRRGQNYCELGANHFDLIDVNHIRLPLARRLERLGHKVTLEPLGQTA